MVFFPNFDRRFYKQTVKFLIRQRNIRYLIWICTVFLSPFSHNKDARLTYCEFGNFASILFSRKALKVIFVRLEHDLHISVNDRVIARNREDFIFTNLRICEVSR